jgi:hypothetical protein
MPAWKSVQGHGRFVGERRLATEEIEFIARWIKQGRPEGHAQDLPAAPRFTEGWKLGQPDIAVTMPSAYEIPAEGPDLSQFRFISRHPAGETHQGRGVPAFQPKGRASRGALVGRNRPGPRRRRC